MEGEQQSHPSSSRQEERDYADSLAPGYRFCPTDSELIVQYLKKKIETGKHPKCRLYEISLYDYNPQELSERYRSLENKWYFLTSRERKYPRGTRPSRKTKNFGCWKTTQKYITVYNDFGEAVGSRRSLVYYDDKERKTSWLMVEYTTNDPNLPIGSDGNKLSDCVLCKVYKKETNLTDNNHDQSRQVQNRRKQVQNQLDDEPPTRRRRVSVQNKKFTSYQQPVYNSIDAFGEPLPPQTHTRINPNYLRGSSSAVHEAIVPNTMTSKDNPTLVTWTNLPPLTLTNNIDEEQSPLTLTDGSDEDQTLVTWINNIYEEQSPLTLTGGSHEDPSLVTLTNSSDEDRTPLTLTDGSNEDQTLMNWINNIYEEQSSLTLTDGSHEDPTLVAWTDEDIESLLMNMF